MTEAERELLSLVIGHRIRALRKTRRMSQSDLATGVGSQSMISLIEGGRQLPLADVLTAVAKKLQDDMLMHYADLLAAGKQSDIDVSDANEDILLEILKTHRGRWQDIHERIAHQLCQHYYYTKNFEKTKEIGRLIINHIHTGPAFAFAAFFLGSVYLYEANYEEAEHWLREAEKLESHLDLQYRGRLKYNLGYAYSYLDVQVLAIWYAKSAVDLFHTLNDFERHAKALGLLGIMQNRLGRFRDSQETLELAYDIATKWNVAGLDIARIVTCLAENMLSLQNLTQAEKYCNIALKLFDSEDAVGMMELERVVCLIALKRGDKETADAHSLESLRYAIEAKDNYLLATAYLLRASLLEDVAQRLEATQKAYESTLSSHHHILQAMTAEFLADVHMELGQSEEAIYYRHVALHAYRQYVRMNSMYGSMLEIMPFQAHMPVLSESASMENSPTM